MVRATMAEISINTKKVTMDTTPNNPQMPSSTAPISPAPTPPASPVSPMMPKMGAGKMILMVVLGLIVGGAATYFLVPKTSPTTKTTTTTTSKTTDTSTGTTSDTSKDTTTTKPEETTTTPPATPVSDTLARLDNFYVRVHGDPLLNVWVGDNSVTVSTQPFVWYAGGIIDVWTISAKLRENPDASLATTLSGVLTEGGYTATGAATPFTFHGKQALKQKYTFDMYGEPVTREMIVALGSTGTTANDLLYVITTVPGNDSYEKLSNDLEFTR